MKFLYIISVIIFISSSFAFSQEEQKEENCYPKFIPYIHEVNNLQASVVKTDIKEYGKEQPARWLSVDPAASKYPGWSPYNYTLNNPLRFIDPKGLNPSDFYDREGEHRHVDDNDQNAYLVSKEKLNKVDSKDAEDTKKDKGTINLGSNSDLMALANVIFNEARGESNSTQIAIAFTVINRSDISGKSIESEVYKPSQFSGIGRLKNLTLDNVGIRQKGDLINSYNSAFDATIMDANNQNPIGNNVTNFYSPQYSGDRPWWGNPQKEVELPSPYNEGNFIYWENLPPYQRK